MVPRSTERVSRWEAYPYPPFLAFLLDGSCSWISFQSSSASCGESVSSYNSARRILTFKYLGFSLSASEAFPMASLLWLFLFWTAERLPCNVDRSLAAGSSDGDSKNFPSWPNFSRISSDFRNPSIWAYPLDILRTRCNFILSKNCVWVRPFLCG